MLSIIGMEGTQQCHCVGGNCLRERLAKRDGLVMWEHVRRIRRMIARCLEDVANSYLRFEENQEFLFLLTLKRDLKWCYKVDELYPKAREFRPWGRCC